MSLDLGPFPHKVEGSGMSRLSPVGDHQTLASTGHQDSQNTQRTCREALGVSPVFVIFVATLTLGDDENKKGSLWRKSQRPKEGCSCLSPRAVQRWPAGCSGENTGLGTGGWDPGCSDPSLSSPPPGIKWAH